MTSLVSLCRQMNVWLIAFFTHMQNMTNMCCDIPLWDQIIFCVCWYSLARHAWWDPWTNFLLRFVCVRTCRLLLNMHVQHWIIKCWSARCRGFHRRSHSVGQPGNTSQSSLSRTMSKVKLASVCAFPLCVCVDGFSLKTKLSKLERLGVALLEHWWAAHYP